MKSKKYIIIGQGIAGTVLSMKMYEQNIPHIVIDTPGLSTSSKIAAGLINPVVLKRYKMVQDAELFLDTALPFYKRWEEKLDIELFHTTAIHHIFSKQENQNQWLEKSAYPPFERFLGPVINTDQEYLNTPLGVGVMKETAWLRTNLFIKAYRQFLLNKDMFKEEHFKQLPAQDLINKHETDQVILCTGHLLKQLVPEDIFTCTRGEVLTIESKDIPQDHIYHAGIFILPLGNYQFKVGSTYHWNDIEDVPTEEGRNQLIEKFEKIFTGKYSIIKHEAGVRPNTKDRKPLLGKYKDFFIFNGLGSRGVLMAPYLADCLVDYITTNKALPLQFNIDRFF